MGPESRLLERLSLVPTKLSDVANRIFQGLKTGADSVFILQVREGHTYYSKALAQTVEREPDYVRPLCKSGDLKRYNLHDPQRTVLIPYSGTSLVPWDVLLANAPLTAKYLLACRPLLEARERGRFRGEAWYCYSRNQALDQVSLPKILTADLNPAANFCIDLDGAVCFPGGAAGGYGITTLIEPPQYVLGLLNSRCVDLYTRHVSTAFRGGWFSYEARVIRQVPIRLPEPGEPQHLAIRDAIIAHVRRIIAMHSQLRCPRTSHEQTALQRQIDATDRQIDQLVYQLYGLTEDEIRIVEESTP